MVFEHTYHKIRKRSFQRIQGLDRSCGSLNVKDVRNMLYEETSSQLLLAVWGITLLVRAGGIRLDLPE